VVKKAISITCCMSGLICVLPIVPAALDRRPRLVTWLIGLRVALYVMSRGHIVRHRHAPIDL